MQQLLMIEDDARLAQMVGEYLERSGFGVTHAIDAKAGLALLQDPPVSAAPELVILDLMLPDMDGLEVCRRIRALPGEAGQVPVLMLTAKGDPMDRIVGLELGADDYLPKPFEPRELLARLKAILRRSRGGQSIDVLRFGRLEIDAGARQVRLDGSEVALTGHQFALLLELARHPGRVMSRDALMELVRNEPLEAFDRSIDVHISRIRAAIEDDAARPRRVITVRGAGYVFAKDQS
jgi:DNA-binding response OmpR family regulator